MQCQIANKSRWLNAKIIVTQSWYKSIERFFQIHTLLFLVIDANLTGPLFNFETTQCKNNFEIHIAEIVKTIILHVCIKVCINFVFLYLQITYCVSTTLIAILGYRFEKSLLTFF